MEEEEFERCSKQLVSMLECFGRIIGSPEDIQQDDLDEARGAVEYIHSKVNSI